VKTRLNVHGLVKAFAKFTDVDMSLSRIEIA